MAVRESLGFETTIVSDCAPLIGPVRALVAAGIPLHCLRDLTRGGLATALIEIAETAGLALRLEQQAIAVSDPVRGACEILGLDPLYVANEGRFVAFVPAARAEEAVSILRRYDAAAAIVGRVEQMHARGEVLLDTIGGSRPLDLLSGEQLPRIC
jgi:hydrogenase expression/formation protein HypE